MAKNDPVPEGNYLVRWIKPQFVGKNDDGTVALEEDGTPSLIFPQAFELREGEDYLSLTDRDLFSGAPDAQNKAAAAALEASTVSGRLSRSGAVAIALCGSIKTCCAEFGHNVRVVREPEAANPAHVAVRKYPSLAPELHEALAYDCFSVRIAMQDLVAS